MEELIKQYYDAEDFAESLEKQVIKAVGVKIDGFLQTNQFDQAKAYLLDTLKRDTLAKDLLLYRINNARKNQ